MELIVHIPDDIAARLEASADDLERRALETLLAEEYRLGHLHKPDLRRALSLETSDQIDTFLKRHNVNDDETLEELREELAGAMRLGL